MADFPFVYRRNITSLAVRMREGRLLTGEKPGLVGWAAELMRVINTGTQESGRRPRSHSRGREDRWWELGGRWSDHGETSLPLLPLHYSTQSVTQC